MNIILDSYHDTSYLSQEFMDAYLYALGEVTNYIEMVIYYVLEYYRRQIKEKINDDLFMSSDEELKKFETICSLCSNDSYKTSFRIKSKKSLEKKLNKKNLNFSVDNFTNKIGDIAGCRFVFGHFLRNVSLDEVDTIIGKWSIDDMVRNVKNCELDYRNNCEFLILEIARFIHVFQGDSTPKIVEDKNYILTPKASGYKSYHIIFKASNGLMVEVQLRTLQEHLWSVCEHQFVYKNDEANSYVKNAFLKTL